MPYYPARNQRSNYHPIQPYSQPRPPKLIVPTASKDHNVAGQVKTLIHLKNARGEEMSIYQTQQVLNLLNGDTGNWMVGNNIYQNKNKRRK